MKVGETTLADLKKVFGNSLSLKESSMDGNSRMETWQVFRRGDMDLGQFVLWGQISHDKDQAIEFKFENDVLVSYQSIAFPDPK